MNIYKELKELCLIPSVSGREDGIRELLMKKISPLADEVYTDALGNLIAVKKGRGASHPSVMLCAHMDEIGFLATFIEDDGRVRVANVGGIGWSAAAFGKVVSEKGLKGVIVPEGKVKPNEYGSSNFYIDIGASSKKEAERRVSVGDFFVLTPTLERLLGKRICGRPIDDRIGCAILLGIAEELLGEKTEGDIYYVFSVQEEVGCRGSKTAAFAIAPDYSLCFDVTAKGDTPGADAMACRIGDGAAIKIKDSSVICHSEIVKKLVTLAEDNKIKYQREILTRGGTDTSSMQLSGRGSMAGALSVPTRYIHSGVETCDLGDAEACIALGVAFVKAISGGDR